MIELTVDDPKPNLMYLFSRILTHDLKPSRIWINQELYDIFKEEEEKNNGTDRR
jgi:hypothetical protein